jgi:polyhydroxyalkanoate synthesis regulator phasin
MKKSDVFSEEARRKIVDEVVSGRISKERARQVYGIKSKSAILEWMRIFCGLDRNSALDPVPLMKNMMGENQDLQLLREKIKRLEEQLKLSELRGRAYQIMVEVAKTDYGLDLEKKPGAKQSQESKKNNQK